MILVDEVPFVKQPRSGGGQPTATVGSEQGVTRSATVEEDSRDEIRGLGANTKQQSLFDKQSSSKALLYYPEENHVPSESACQSFNSRIMKHLMKQKMQKNDTFYVSKVLKGDNHFLRRQTSSPMQNRMSQNLRPSSQSKRLAHASGANKQLVKSTPELNLELSGTRSGLELSRVNNLQESTKLAVDSSFGVGRARV